MLHSLSKRLISPAKMQFRSVFFRTAQKAKQDLYGKPSNIVELLGVSKNADAK